MLSKEVLSTIFQVFGMTRPGIEPWSPGPLANTLPTRPIVDEFNLQLYYNVYFQTKTFWENMNTFIPPATD